MNDLPEAPEAPTAVRVWTVRTRTDPGSDPDGEATDRPPSSSKRPVWRRYPAEALVFDTETRDEAGQRLMLGVWRFFRDDADTGQEGQTCVEEGFFYPDHLSQTDPEGWQRLQAYVHSHDADVAVGFSPRLLCKPLSWWLQKRLHLYGDRHRKRCAIVGFNLPYDLGAIASHWGTARGLHRGGWSLGMWGHFDAQGVWHDQPYHRRILARSIDPRRTLFAWGGLKDRDDPDFYKERRFVDLRTLTFALTDRSHSLETACAAFGAPYAKAEVTHGVIDERMLHYAREDVTHTAALYRNCLTELARHEGVDLQPYALYSPAGVGTQYLRAMGVTPPLEKFRDLDPRYLGWAMSSFFGGRAEARIVRTPVPVVVADFTSMYPAINALLSTWRVLTAERVSIEDVTAQVRTFLGQADLRERLFDPHIWTQEVGITLVQLDHPRDVILPVRAAYDPNAADYGIGLNPLTYEGQLWYALPDVLAARLLSDAPIHITQALRLRAVGQQSGLNPLKLRGHRQVDPHDARNPFVTMIEERHRVKRDPNVSDEEKQRLDLFLKITANATAYGSLARFDRRDQTQDVGVTVYGPGDEGFDAKTSNPEDPGPYCFPPVAASITAGARLMLALIERALTDMGGSHAFMDTDSIAIVATPHGDDVPCTTATGETVTSLSHDDVRTLLRRFEALNPYGGDVINDDPDLGRSPWKVEHNSLHANVWAYVIATKRYALYTPTENGPELIDIADRHEESGSDAAGIAETDQDLADWSEHGLGMYLDPTDNADTDNARDSQGRRIWIRDAWLWILTNALTGQRTPMPPWAKRFAITQFTVSTPRHATWFRLDEPGPQAHRPRPFGFGLLGHVDPIASHLNDHRPAAPYTRKPTEWPGLPWYDRHTQQRLLVRDAYELGDDPAALQAALAAGEVPLRPIGDVLHRYGERPELKSLAPTGRSSGATTQGQLLRRPVHSGPALTAYIGKEGNRLLERATGEITDPDEYRTTYSPPGDRRWTELVLPILREIRESEGHNRSIAAGVGVSERQVRKWLTGDDIPHAGATGNRQRAERFAVAWTAEQLSSAGRPVPSHGNAVLYAYLSTAARRQL